MKKVLIAIIAMFVSLAALAQDNIYYKDGKEEKTKIVEIRDAEVVYKKFENLDGPSYTVSKSEILMIIYQNGSKDIFNTSSTPTNTTNNTNNAPVNNSQWGNNNSSNTTTVTAPPKVEEEEYPKIELISGKYYIDGRESYYTTFLAKSRNLKDTKLNIMIYKAENASKAGTGLMVPGIIFTVVGALFIPMSYSSSFYPLSSGYGTSSPVFIGGAIMAGAGVAMLTSGIVLKCTVGGKRRKAVNRYNELLAERKK